MSIISTRYGKMRIIEADNVVSRALALYGEWAKDELSLLERIITPGMCVLDIGAFIGTHTLAFSKFVGQQGCVYSFEPRKEIFTILSENISLNHCRNVTALNIGLTEKEQTLSVESLDINQGINFGGLALDTKENSLKSNYYQIHVSTIDSMDISKIDVLKLDVEGMERKVLDGAIKTVLRDKPVIFCECNSLVSGNEILEFCEVVGYETYGFLAPAYNPNNFNATTENFFGAAKELALVLLPQEKHVEILKQLTSTNLLPIKDLEDLVLPLLHKPQYVYEVLAYTAPSSLLGIDFPSPSLSERDGQIAERDQQIAERDQQIAERDQQIAERDGQIANLNMSLDETIRSTSWRITAPLRKISQWRSQIMRLMRLYQNYRRAYPGFSGLKRLSYKCIDTLRKEGHTGLRNKVSLHEYLTYKAPILENIVTHQCNAKINLLHTYLEKGLITNPTIIFDHNGGGGSNTYTHELVNIILSNGGMVLRIYYFNAACFVQWISSNEKVTFHSSTIEELLTIISASRSSSIIINSLYGHPNISIAVSNIINLARTLEATLELKIHDFYSLCPSPHLSDFEEKYCGVPQNFEVCTFCLKKNLNWYHSWYPDKNKPISIVAWRKPFVEIFQAATTITFFDSSSVEIFRKAFHLEDNKIQVIPHVIRYFKCDNQIDLTGSLHIGILGTLFHMKGGSVVKALADYIKEQDMYIPITVVGSSFVDIPPSVNVHGNYTQNDLPIIMRKQGINAILMPSIIPETFSYTISEAMEMGLPIVAFDLGAQGNRVRQYTLGKVIPLDSSPAMILAAIQSVLKVAQEKK